MPLSWLAGPYGFAELFAGAAFLPLAPAALLVSSNAFLEVLLWGAVI